MKALTLIQPWAWAVCHAGKRIENRTWRPPPSVIGQRIAIHAGKKFDAEDAEWITGTLQRQHAVAPGRVPEPRFLASGAIVAVATLAGCVEYGRDLPPAVRGLEDSQRIWAFGPWCWLLDGVRVLAQPVPCRGAQGLWDVPAEVERAVLAQLSQSQFNPQ